MPKFSDKSNKKLDTCQANLQRLFRAVVVDFDCTALEGHRARRRQNQFFKDGRSKVKWPDGKHNVMPSEAADVAPWIDGRIPPWKDLAQFYFFAGFVKAKAMQMDIPIRWGGDWDSDFNVADQKFNDLIHWESMA